MKIDIYKDGIGYVTNEVSTVKTCEANLNEENRMKFVTDLAAVSRGKSESKNPPARYRSLLKEAAPTAKQVMDEYSSKDNRGKALENIYDNIKGSPSRPLEFLPVVLKVYSTYDPEDITGFDSFAELCDSNGAMLFKMKMIDFLNTVIRFSYMDGVTLYTNMRCLVNAGMPYEKIPYNTPEELKDFVALKARVPMFTWAQVPNTHTMISKEAETDRHKTKPDYWMPSDFRQKVYDYYVRHDFLHKNELQKELLLKDGNTDGTYPSKIMCKMTTEINGIQDFSQIPHFLTNGSTRTNTMPTQNDVQQFFKELGYKAEIYQRAMYYFKYKTVVMTGWNTDPKVWSHLLIERSVKPEIWKNWTQDITRDFVEGIKEIITKGAK